MNVLTDPDTDEVIGLLDFELAGAGFRVQDILAALYKSTALGTRCGAPRRWLDQFPPGQIGQAEVIVPGERVIAAGHEDLRVGGDMGGREADGRRVVSDDRDVGALRGQRGLRIGRASVSCPRADTRVIVSASDLAEEFCVVAEAFINPARHDKKGHPSCSRPVKG